MGKRFEKVYDINSPQLLKTPLPQADESLMGYILRLTEENVYLSSSWIFDLAGLKVNIRAGGWPTLYRDIFDSSGLEYLTRLERKEIDKLRYQITDADDSLYICGTPIDFVRYSLPKVCPTCLKQSGYCRYIWDLLPVTACPVHKVILIDKCPECQRRIRWVRQNISKCRCGVDWRDTELSRVALGELKLSRLIYELCGIAYIDSYSSNKEIHSSTLNLHDLIQVLTVMADYYLLITTGQRITTTTENALCHTAYSFVGSILENWPRNFFRFLAWVRKHAGYMGISDLHRSVSKQCGKPSLFFVVAALEDFIEKTWHMLEDSGGLYLPTKRQFINKEEACIKLDIDEDLLDRLIARGEFKCFRNGGTEILIYVPSIKSSQFRLMTHRSAAESLGIRASDVIYLIHNGCLQPFRETKIDGFSQWDLDSHEVRCLMSELAGKIINVELPEYDKVTFGCEVSKYLQQYGLSLGKFILDILNDEIVPIGKLPGDAITKLLFRKDQVIRYRRNLHPEDRIDLYDYCENFPQDIRRRVLYRRAYQMKRVESV